MYTDINLWAVLLAAASDMVIGMLWYSPMLFYKPWISQLGKTDRQLEEMKKRGMTATIGGAFLTALITAYVLAQILEYAEAHTFLEGLEGGFWVWLGFMFAGSYGHYFFPGRTLRLYLIDKGYDLVKILIMSTILVMWS